MVFSTVLPLNPGIKDLIDVIQVMLGERSIIQVGLCIDHKLVSESLIEGLKVSVHMR